MGKVDNVSKMNANTAQQINAMIDDALYGAAPVTLQTVRVTNSWVSPHALPGMTGAPIARLDVDAIVRTMRPTDHVIELSDDERAFACEDTYPSFSQLTRCGRAA